MKNRHRVNQVVSKYLPTGGGRKILKQGEAHAADVAKLPELAEIAETGQNDAPAAHHTGRTSP